MFCSRFVLSLHRIGFTSAIEASFIAFGLHYPCTMYYMLKVKNMEQQILQFNQAQLQLLDMMSFVKTPEALSDLNKAILKMLWHV